MRPARARGATLKTVRGSPARLALFFCALGFVLRVLAVVVAPGHFWAYTVYYDMAKVLASGGGAMASGSSDGQVAALAGGLSPFVPTDDGRIDIARIEGQVKASSVKKVSEFVDRHPDESVAILRAWLHDN